MNIFKSLTTGHGSISETNITSFLSFLLNSTNEFDNAFLVLFFELLDNNLPGNKILDLLQLRQRTTRETIALLSKKYTINAQPELRVKNENSGQIIDIVVTISDKTNENDVAYILIENKIKLSAKKKEQVSKQYQYFRQSDVNAALPVYSLLLTTDYDAFSSMHDNALQVHKNVAWLRWTNNKDTENSIEAILRKMLILEQQALIQPINPNSQFIIKSFIDYIVTEYANNSSGGKNFSFNGSDEIEKARVNLNGKTYILRRYENKMVRVFDEDDNVLDIEVLPLLKQLKDKYKLDIPIEHKSGTPKNTQVFGREIISGINAIQSMTAVK